MYIELYLKVAIVFLLIQNKKPMPWDFSEKKIKRQIFVMYNIDLCIVILIKYIYIYILLTENEKNRSKNNIFYYV